MTSKDLGLVTAYAYAVSQGYTGTEEEFAELMASYATVAEEAAESAAEAAASAEAAGASETNAASSAASAGQSATSAGNSATSASGSAVQAQSSATAAGQSATQAAGSATAAGQSATAAAGSASQAAASETAAGASATAAAGSATSASGSATAAAGSATEADASADRAQEILDSIPEDYSELSEDVSDLKSAFDSVASRNLYNPDDPDVAQNTYINPNGRVETVTNRTVTGFMPVQAGKKVVLSRLNGSTREEMTWASICFYSGAKSVVSGGQYNTNKLTVPSGSAYARVTFASNLKDVQIECNDTGNMTSYEAYFTQYTELDPDIKVQISSIIGIDSIKNVPDSFGWRGAMASGDTIKLPVTNVKNQQVYAFSGDISSFGKIKIGRMLSYNTTYGAFEIDSTNVKFYCDNGLTYTIPHGLTIQNNIQIEFATENTTNLSKAVITSNGVRFDILANLTNKRFLGDEGAPFVQSDGSVLSDCSFTWTSRNIAKPIWMFGDSYMSLYDVRWVYYLIQDGYDKSCLINAYAGEASAAALMSMKNLLTLKSRPRYILWALGMNDPDTDSAVNTSWKNCYDAVIDLCERNGIIPVLATIPNTPTNNNTYKNAIVKSSGYRYIDFASAVGATEAESGWYSGMLNSDNVHPNIPGAIALYYQALADFPELTSD